MTGATSVAKDIASQGAVGASLIKPKNGSQAHSQSRNRHRWPLRFATALGIGSAMVFCGTIATAQITPDGSINFSITPDTINGTAVERIDGGVIQGVNLFHSFSDFNVNLGQHIYFNNPDGINNILSRVTGINPSNIQGTLGVLGGANLFLLNPNGILFGPNARLDLSGSFIGTTANAIGFPSGGEFSQTSDPTNPLLVLNPSALLFNQMGNPPRIEVTGANLSVGSPGNPSSLLLVGGDVLINGATLQGVEGSNIQIGGFTGAGNVELSVDGNALGSIVSVNGVSGANVFITNGSVVNVGSSDNDAGSIQVTGSTLALTNGSQLSTSTFGMGNAGFVSLQAETIAIDNSSIFSTAEAGATGDAGAIGIDTGSISLNNSRLDTTNYGLGAAGNIIVSALDQISIANNSEVVSRSSNDASGFSTLELTATEGSVLLDNSTLSTSNFGTGFAGNIIIGAADQVSIIQSSVFSDGFAGRIILDAGAQVSLVNSELYTESENENISEFSVINIAANSGSVLLNQSTVSTTNISSGAAGDISISASDEISIFNQSEVFSNGNYGRIFIGASDEFDDSISPTTVRIDDSRLTTESTVGRAGEININAIDNVLITNIGLDADNNPRFSTNSNGIDVVAGDITIQAGNSVAIANSIITSEVSPQATGDAGTIGIMASSVSLTDASELRTLVLGTEGNAGTVSIQTNGGTAYLNNSRIFSTIESGAVGVGGNIEIDTGSLLMENDSGLQTLLRSGAAGTAGVIVVVATDSVSLSQSGMFSTIEEGAIGNTGNNQFAGDDFDPLFDTNDSAVGSIFVATGTLSLTDNSDLNASTFGIGNAGAVFVLANGAVSLSNDSRILSGVGPNAVGSGGGILLQARSLSATNSSDLTTQSEGLGNAGFIYVETERDISLRGEGSGIFSTVQPEEGSLNYFNPDISAGGIVITARSLFLRDGAKVSVNNLGSGVAGNISVTAAQDIILRNGAGISAVTRSGDGGNIELNAGDFFLLLGSSETSTTAGLEPAGGDGGNVTINTRFIIAAPPKDNNITAQAYRGRGGNIQLNIVDSFDIEERDDNFPNTNDITASSRFGIDGEVANNTVNADPTQGFTNPPIAIIDPSNQITPRCVGLRNPTGEENQFIVTGRGGLRPNPTETLGGESLVTDWVRVDEEDETPTSEMNSPDSSQRVAAQSSSPKTPLVEAQGWAYDATGKVILTAQAPHATLNSSSPIPTLACNGS